MQISLNPQMLIIGKNGMSVRDLEGDDVVQVCTGVVRSQLLQIVDDVRPEVVLVDLSLGRDRALRVGYAITEADRDAVVLLNDSSEDEGVLFRLSGSERSGFISLLQRADDVLTAESPRHLCLV